MDVRPEVSKARRANKLSLHETNVVMSWHLSNRRISTPSRTADALSLAECHCWDLTEPNWVCLPIYWHWVVGRKLQCYFKVPDKGVCKLMLKNPLNSMTGFRRACYRPDEGRGIEVPVFSSCTICWLANGECTRAGGPQGLTLSILRLQKVWGLSMFMVIKQLTFSIWWRFKHL